MKKVLYEKKIDLLVGLLIACIYILFSVHSFPVLESLGRIIYGIQMRLDLPQDLGTNKVAIVNIDDKSLRQLGSWPWPRQIIAEIIPILKNNGAELIGLQLLFNEKEQNQGLREIRDLKKAIRRRDQRTAKDPWLLNALEEMEKRLDNDRILSQTIKESGNIYLPLIGTYGQYETELVLSEDSFISRNAVKIKGPLENLSPANKLSTPFSELAENTRGLGHINQPSDKSMEGQAHPLLINYRGNVIPSLPFRLSLDFLHKTAEETIIPGKGILLTDTLLPTRSGEIFLKFRGTRRSFPYYSFVDILHVKKVPAVFEGKIVLIGYTGEGAHTVDTPVDPALPQVELTANVIDNLINGRYLKRPSYMPYVETFLLLVLSLFASLSLPRFGFLNRLGVTVSLIFMAFLIGLLAFMVLDVRFKMIYIGLSLLTILAEYSVRDIIVAQRALTITSKESIETNRMLGLSLQSQGLFDLSFEKFRKCPLDDAMKDVIYNLGLDYERKRMLNKAVSVYEYITRNDKSFRDLRTRVPKLRKLIGPIAISGHEMKKEGKIVVSDDLEIKPTVGRYEILSELGQGAMGVVYKARDPKINRLLAIKTIRFSDEFEDEKIKEIKERFLREAEISGQLSHPTIVAIYDVGEDFDLTYMAMEFLEGENLQKYCRKGSLLPLRKALYVISETALALDYAHKHGVIHRDVKPANIMLLKDGKIKVTDFGIAKAVSSSQTKSGIVLGTPNYMSPEQINGHEIDGRSDIFSLGVVFFELLTGQLPFHGKNLTNLFYQITQVRHPSPRAINPKVPKPCEQIVDSALAKDPSKRFESSASFAKYIKALIYKIDQVRLRAAEPDS
ncbi:MAG: serine/threonine-protein kinase [Desulfobacteraceae bacterium]|jgi:serine/threonine-protein kinase